MEPGQHLPCSAPVSEVLLLVHHGFGFHWALALFLAISTSCLGVPVLRVSGLPLSSAEWSHDLTFIPHDQAFALLSAAPQLIPFSCPSSPWAVTSVCITVGD